MQVTYPGPYEAVTVPALGRDVAKDETITVAAHVGESLLAQGWTQPKRKAKEAD